MPNLPLRTIENNARKSAFERMVLIFTQEYGDFVHVVGDSEIAVRVDTSPDNEPIYATFSPKIKPFRERKTPNKTIHVYDVEKEEMAYQKKKASQAEKAEKQKTST